MRGTKPRVSDIFFLINIMRNLWTIISFSNNFGEKIQEGNRAERNIYMDKTVLRFSVCFQLKIEVYYNLTFVLARITS